MNDGTCFSIFSSGFCIFSILDFDISNRYMVVHHYYFNMKFLNNVILNILSIFIGHIYIYMHIYTNIYGLPLWLSWQRICIRWGKPGFSPWVGKIPCRRERLPIPGFWPGEFHRLYRAWGRKESDMTEWLSLWHINIYSCIYFGKVSLQSFTCIFCLFLSFESFSVFWIQFFYWYAFCKNFLQLRDLSFHSLKRKFCKTEVFNFNEVQFMIFFLSFIGLLV